MRNRSGKDSQIDAITYSYSGLVCFDRDTDGDDTPDRLDKDSDGDGIPDVIEAGGTAQADGTISGFNSPANDGNGNGLLDAIDPDATIPGTPLPLYNSDSDALPDLSRHRL